MLLIKPSPISWADSDNLVANIHHLTLGYTINCCILGIGDGDVRLGLSANSDRLEEILAPMLKDQLGNEPEDGRHWQEMFSLRRNKPHAVLNLQVPHHLETHPPRGKDPMASVYAALNRVPTHEVGGVSWVLRARHDGGFDAHGVSFATGRELGAVMDRASYVAAAYGALGFRHARKPMFPKWAWRSVLSLQMRSPHVEVPLELVSQVWHPPIAEGG